MRVARRCGTLQALRRGFANTKVASPPLVVITGEEFTRYAGELYLEKWVRPYVDTSKWEYFDLSCVARDKTGDQVLRDAIAAGKRTGAIYKEPTITPTAEQAKAMGLSKVWGSPNGLMRKGWNGITISRDTILIEGMQLGYKNPVLFDRHAVGGEYGAAFKMLGPGRVETQFYPQAGGAPVKVDDRTLTDAESAVVVYDNPYDNIRPMAHHFLGRCLEAGVTPCVVSKHTVFKWQHAFFRIMKEVYDQHYKSKFLERNIKMNATGDLQHFLSDVATMQLIRWTDGGFGMAALNYDGDVLTDELAQIHRSPGFLSSVLNGVNDDGTIIKEFEASHGTVTDMWNAHRNGKETSLNPLSMMEALVGAMQHSAKLRPGQYEELIDFSKKLQKAIHEQMVQKGTRDLDKNGLTTEQFVDAVALKLEESRKTREAQRAAAKLDPREYDEAGMRKLFEAIDANGDGTIDFGEFATGMKRFFLAQPGAKAKI